MREIWLSFSKTVQNDLARHCQETVAHEERSNQLIAIASILHIVSFSPCLSLFKHVISEYNHAIARTENTASHTCGVQTATPSIARQPTAD
jgi:hypothetical protein